MENDIALRIHLLQLTEENWIVLNVDTRAPADE
jgi:hypothetical protein